jgi:hypothetical protein
MQCDHDPKETAMTSTAIADRITGLEAAIEIAARQDSWDRVEQLRDEVDQLHADLHSVRQDEAIQAVVANPATEPQINFIATLASERDWNAIGQDVAARFQATMEQGVDKAKASKIIEWLMKQPKQITPATPAPAAGQSAGVSVPDGYYAVAQEGHKNALSFFRLRTGKKGKWAGFQFIDLLASTTPYPVRGKDAREKVYAAIREVGVNEARQAYGREIGSCGVCNRPLTDDHSRALGIGPVCAEGF